MKYKAVFKSSLGKSDVIKVYDELLQAWPVPYQENSLKTTYGETHIITSGDKSAPPLMLLHGTSSNATMWIADVAEYAKYYCVYALDIPGEPGKSEERQYSLKSSAYTEWLHEVVTHLQLDKLSLVGISLGAWMAIGYSVKYPQKVEKLVLLSPSGIGSQKYSFMFRAFLYMLLGDWGFDRAARLITGQTIPKAALEYTKLIAKHNNLRTEAVPLYTDAELRHLNMPLLLYAGDKDVLLNSKETTERITRLLPQAQAHLLPGYAHVLVGFENKIVNFLRDT